MSFSSVKFRSLLYWFLIVALIIALEAVFFRSILLNGQLIGDDGDTRLNILIMEHIWQFLNGAKNFTDLGMFYPYLNTISYSDMNVGFAIPYAVFRFLGTDIWFAGKLTLVLTHFFGTLTLFLFLLKKMRLSTICSLLGVILFSFSNTYSVKLGHTQLISVSLVPVLLWTITNFFEHIQNEEKRFRFACFSIVWYALICYTSFYIGFFTALFSFLFGISYVILNPASFQKGIRFLRQNMLECLAYLGLSVFVMAPFISIYMPARHMFGNRPYDVIQLMLPTAFDFVNVSPKNLFYGEFINQFPSMLNRPYGGELQVGFPFLTLTFILLIGGVFLWNYFRHRHQVSPLKAAWSLAIFCSFILIFKTSQGHSLWYYVWAYVPGADSMRAVSRYLIFLTLPCAILTAVGVQLFLNQMKNKQFQAQIMVVLCLLLWAENLHTRQETWDIQSRRDFNQKISTPLNTCQIFYLWDSKGEKAPYRYQLDAWEIATYFKISTINGYSGQFPKDWSNWKLFRVNEASYLPGIQKYVAHYHINNVCAYDIGTNTWEMVPPNNP